MADDLTVFSWNLEKKSLGGLTSEADNVPRIVSSLIKTVGQDDPVADPPFIGFLLEIKGPDGSVAQMCKVIEKEYRRQSGGKEITVSSRSTNGAPGTIESIITLSRGVEVTSTKFDVQKGLKAFIEQDKASAARAFGEHNKMVERRFRSRKDHPYKAKEQHYRKLNRDPEWFRNGVIAEVKQGGRTLRVASVHAPGPDVSDKVEEVVDSIVQSAVGNKVDILIGDLNRRGSLESKYYKDLSRTWTTGTTLGKNENANQLGESRWDRILASQDRIFDIASPDPVAVTRGAELKRLTDHALVYARVSDRPVQTIEPPFSLETAPPRPGGVDLASLASAQALVEPQATPLAYAAATDRSAKTEPPQSENPLATPSTEPPTDPLSPPTTSSPLTGPPPTSAMDETMEDASEEGGADEMAEEADTGAEVAELVLLA